MQQFQKCITAKIHTGRFGVNTDGSQWTRIYTGSAASVQWEQTTTDMLGRTIRVEKPGADNGVEISGNYYNDKGQLVRTTVSAQADMLYEYDELGRAIDGTVTGTSEERGYDFEVRFRSDGTKEGDLIRDGIKVGELTMSVDAEQFHNYLNVETNQEERLAKPNYWNAE